MTQLGAYAHDNAGHGDHGHGDEPHVLPISLYLAVWGTLVFLTVVTVAVSRFDFGSANTLIAMLVATVKASLVALYFMHLRYDNKFNLVILLASLLFVAVFFTPTLIDLGTRGALDPVKARETYKMRNAKPVTPVAPTAAESTLDPIEALKAGEPAAATEHAPAAAPAPAAPAQPNPAAPAAPAAAPAAPAAPAAAAAPAHH